jgi:uncharacterized protein involved in exopolysaccharide biosynthesis
MIDKPSPASGLILGYLRALSDCKWLALTIMVVSVGTAVSIALVLPPTFRAEAVLSPANHDSAGAGGIGELISRYSDVASLAGVSVPGGSGNESEAVATLSSRALLRAFIEESNLLPVLFPDAWDAATRSWKSDDAPTVWHGIREFQSRIMNVATDRRTGLVTLTIDWRDGAVAAEWASQLIARTNETLRRRTIEEGQNSIEHLNVEVERTTEVQLRNALYRLIETQLWRVTMATVTREYAFRVIDPPMPPAERFRPRRAQIALTGLMLGLVLVAGLVVFRANNRLRE